MTRPVKDITLQNQQGSLACIFSGLLMHIDAICKKCLWKNVPRLEISCILRENKGFRNRLYLFNMFYTMDKIPTIFSNWEPGAQPKLAHAYYVFPL